MNVSSTHGSQAADLPNYHLHLCVLLLLQFILVLVLYYGGAELIVVCFPKGKFLIKNHKMQSSELQHRPVAAGGQRFLFRNDLRVPASYRRKLES